MNPFYEHKMDVMLSRFVVNKLPKNDGRHGAFHRSFFHKSVTPFELKEHIKQGYAYQLCYRGNRKRDNFIGASFIALDFDTVGIDTVKKHRYYQFSSFCYSTPSSTPDNPKCRLVFALERPITDPDDYEFMYALLLKAFPLADKNTSSASQFFYGSLNCTGHAQGQLLTREPIFTLRVIHGHSVREEMKAKEDSRKNTVVQPTIIVKDTDDIKRTYAKEIIRRRMTMLANTPHGKGMAHPELKRTCLLMLNYIHAPWFAASKSEVEYALKSVVKNWGGSVRSDLKTIEYFLSLAPNPRYAPSPPNWAAYEYRMSQKRIRGWNSNDIKKH